ncbi:MAG: exonuclease SbcCD subunit D [Candidatus Aenigmatarchaeota archaeon]
MTKIAVISDLHLGFKKGTQREEDVFIAAERALKKAERLGADVIVLPGDIFDSRLPRPEHWSRFMEMLSSLEGEKNVDVTRLEGKEEVPERALEGIPIIAIHGTHERRGKGMKNTIKALEDSKFLVHLHCSSIELKVNGEKIGVHGMSGVPEKYSKDVLKKWNPEPFEDAYNIFMLHQDLEQYIYNPVNPPSLGLEDLPEGFDLYVSGHIHWKEETELKGKPFIIPGSLVPTQLKKKEAERSKGFYLVDTEKREVDFVEIDPPREFIYKELEFEGKGTKEIEEDVLSALEKTEIENYETNPLVRVKIKGKLPKGVSSSDLDLSSIKEKYDDKTIISFSEDLQEKGIEEKVQTLQDLREEKLSVDEMGMKILREKVKEVEAGIEPDVVFENLVEGDLDDALEKIKDMDVEHGEEGAKKEGDKKEEGSEDTGKGNWWEK